MLHSFESWKTQRDEKVGVSGRAAGWPGGQWRWEKGYLLPGEPRSTFNHLRSITSLDVIAGFFVWRP